MTLVIGATGHVGRQVVAQLASAGAFVRALARDPAAADLPAGVDVVRGDLLRPETLEPALRGVDAVFLVWPFRTTDAAPAVLDVIARNVRHVVYLSSMGAGPDKTDPIPFHAEIERLIESSGLDWTFFRSSGFATNTLMWAEQIRAGDVVRWPSGAARRSLIDERDIAAVAVAALTRDRHRRVRHLLTGPQAVSQVEQVQTIGDALGRHLRYEELSRSAARELLLAAWGDPSFADSALDTWAGFVAEPELVTSTVESITGEPAGTFREWASDHAGDFR